jgi:hypothetical protein
VFEGDNRRITRDICFTAKILTVRYSAAGKEPFPDFYHLSVWLYESETESLVGGVSKVKGIGTSKLTSFGPGRYYLEIVPSNARWTVRVGQ